MRLRFGLRKTSGTLSPYVELYNPSGTRIGGPGSQINATLSEAGVYLILMRDQSNLNTGDYVLLWQRMNTPCGAASVDCGQVVTGSIGTVADPPPWRFHTFTGAANDVITVRVTKTSGSSFSPTMELFGPNGTYITTNSSMDRTLTTSGTYALLVRDYNNGYAGDYLVTLQRVKSPCNATPADCGQPVSGVVNGAGQINIYTFTASANDAITIRTRKTSGTLSPYVELYNPSGTRIGGPGSQINATLSEAGVYLILMRDQFNLNTGDYILAWQKI